MTDKVSAVRVDNTISPRLQIVASLTGYAITAAVIVWSLTTRGLGADISVWDRVGDQVWAGVSPYGQDYPWGAGFFYAPPWAVAFGLMSWLPVVFQAGIVFGLELAALRYVSRSWLAVGWLGLCPITGGELANGSFNLVLAAGLLAAMRGDARLAMVGALAKLSPILAIREWRGPALILGASVLVTLPVFGWWSDWIRQLVWASGQSIGFPIPVWLRAGIGLVILALWRSPKAGVLAAAISIPGLYSYSLVLLYPLLTRPAPSPRSAGGPRSRLARCRCRCSRATGS